MSEEINEIRQQRERMTIRRLLKNISEGKRTNVKFAVDILRSLNVEEEKIQKAIVEGQEKVAKKLEDLFYENTGIRMFE